MDEKQECALSEARFAMGKGCFKGLFESMSDGLIYIDPNHVILNANPAFCAMLGYPVEAVLGKNSLDFSVPEQHEAELALVHDLLNRTESVVEFEKAFIHAEGHHVQAQVRFWRCPEGQNEMGDGAWGTVRNLTAQREAESVAARSQEQYRFFAENSEDVIWAVDEDYRYTYVSPSVERLRGYTPDEIIGRRIQDSLSPRSAAKVNKVLREAQAEAHQGKELTISRIEVELACKWGGTVWVESVVKAVWGDDGEWMGCMGATRDISGRKKMEERLRKSEQSMRALLDAITEPVGLLTLEGEILAVNQTLADILDRSIENAVGCNVYDLMPKVLVGTVRNAFVKAVSARKPVSESTIWGGRMLESVSYPVVEDDEVTTIAICSRDVTETRYAEEARKKTQEQYRLMVETANEGILGLDANWRITFANDLMADFLGYELDEVIGKRYTCFLAPEDLDNYVQCAEELVQGSRYRRERKFLHKDGNYVWGLVSVSPMKADDGSHLGAFAMIADITEVKQAHERLLTILDGMSAYIYVSDMETNEMLFMNARMRERFGACDSGTPCHMHVRGLEHECDNCTKLKIVDEKGQPTGTIVSERYSERYNVWYLNYDSAIEWLRGRVVHMHMGTDITELKSMAGELENAMVEAQAASLSKNEFLANMSHEIRTPLNGLLGMMQLLQLTNLKPVQKDYLETALNSGRNLLQILNDILDLSKVESGKLELEAGEFELDEMLDSVISTFRLDAKECGLDMRWTVDPDLPTRFMADKGRLRQILFNLVGNAVKFTDHGSIHLEAYPFKGGSEDAVRLFFQVSDTGIGIPEDKISDVFDPFTQADGSTTRKYQGTGLGLGIVHRLVSLMDGTLYVDSKVGVGTTVVFTILVKPVADQYAKRKVRLEVPPDMALSVLVAEDERVNRVVVERLLKKFGHNVLCVDSGEAALDILGKESFDLILTDIQMPGLDGVETTRAIRGELGIETPIIALTAHAMKGDKDRFLEAGMNGYIAKPFQMEGLRKEIERVMSRTVGLE